MPKRFILNLLNTKNLYIFNFYRLLFLGSVTVLVILFYNNYNQFLFPPFYVIAFSILLGHVLCSLSYLITSLSFNNTLAFFRNSFLIYTEKPFGLHLYVSLTASIFEEILFRYFFLFLLIDLLNSTLLSVFLTSVLFVSIHYKLGWKGIKSAFLYFDLFLFSIILCALNIYFDSFYPALIIHFMRNYILKALTTHKS